MAPVSHVRSQTRGGVGKKVNRKTRTNKEPSDSWELLAREGLNPDAGGQDVMETQNKQNLPADVEDTVDPLREMAERVGREVERFAETLDEYASVSLLDAASRYDTVHDLVLQFKDIAETSVKDLQHRLERDVSDQLKKEWNERAKISAATTSVPTSASLDSSPISVKKAEQVKRVRQWQQEADLWELFRVTLEVHIPEAEAHSVRTEREEELAKLGPPHRYLSEGELWERFLLEDNLAHERFRIKAWLEDTANHQLSGVQGIVEELEAKAGRGKGLWSSGWLHTREKIKGEKRLRAWPDAVDSPLPQIKRSDNNELLVTTLDPDAPYRQQRTLERPDSFFERAIWVACWEMLRRGQSSQDVCDWCEERKEGWRAVCMGMAREDIQSASSHPAFRRMCYLASQSGYTSDYEAAVFGLLGGSVKAVEKVCATIDDHLYAYYSAMLMRQFDQYVVSVCPEKAMSRALRRNSVDESMLAPERAEQEVSNLINRLRTKSSTSVESGQPMKIIQSFLLANQVGSLIHTVAVAIAETATLHGPEDMIYLADRTAPADGEQRPEAEVALDPQTLRMTAHMSILHRILSPEEPEGPDQDEDENVLVAYIQALRAAGKRSIIPTYASKLQRARCIVVLGRVLQDITESLEQTEMLRLLQQYHLDVVAILAEQLAWVMERCLNENYATKPLHILEQSEDTKLHPGQRIIVDFLPDAVTSDDEAVIRCLQWFQLLRGRWLVTFEALTLALRRCLVTGRFACARAIVQDFPYEKVSLQKSYETVGHSLNLMDNTATYTPENEQESVTLDIMRRQSRTYFELEQLVRAVESLSEWRRAENKYVSKAPKPSTVPSDLKQAKEDVSEDMEPLLKGILQNPLNEEESEDLAHIRLTYLPEIVIAYNTVLHAAGNLITRDSLLESMDLSVLIAGGPKQGSDAEEDGGLASCFVQAGRMRELVSSFALTSKIMLVLKAEGKPWKPRKDREGKDLGVWEIGSVAVRSGRSVEDR